VPKERKGRGSSGKISIKKKKRGGEWTISGKKYYRRTPGRGGGGSTINLREGDKVLARKGR